MQSVRKSNQLCLQHIYKIWALLITSPATVWSKPPSYLKSRDLYFKTFPPFLHSFYTIYKIQEPQRPIWNQRELMGNRMVPVCKSSVALHAAQYKTYLFGRLRLNRTCLVLSFAGYQLSFFLYLFYCICLPWWRWQSIVYQMNKREVYFHKVLSNQDLSNILCFDPLLLSWYLDIFCIRLVSPIFQLCLLSSVWKNSHHIGWNLRRLYFNSIASLMLCSYT